MCSADLGSTVSSFSDWNMRMGSVILNMFIELINFFNSSTLCKGFESYTTLFSLMKKTMSSGFPDV